MSGIDGTILTVNGLPATCFEHIEACLPENGEPTVKLNGVWIDLLKYPVVIQWEKDGETGGFLFTRRNETVVTV